MASQLKLYSYYRSSCSYRVRIAMAHKGIDYTYVPVHLVKDGGEQNQAAYRAHNPMGEVPALELVNEAGETEGVIAQSMAIIEYLEEAHPTPALLPKDALLRAKVRQIAECINTSIQPIQNLRVMQHIRATFGVDRDATIAWNHHWIDLGFQGVEKLLAQSAGTYAVGDSITFADVFLVPQHYNAVRFNVDMTQFPTIAKVVANALPLPAFQAAAPDAQPDAV